MGKRITIKEIAEHLKVSISTVSKALNDSKEISQSTKKRIQAFARAHNYRPNKLALGLQNKRTRTLAVIVPNILNDFFSKVFAGIEEVATANDYTLISCISNESYAKEVKTLELLNNGTLDGLLISLAEETQLKNDYSHFNFAKEDGVEIVLFDRITEKIECDKVVVDDFNSAYNATNHLIKTGCKTIAVISIIDNLNIGKIRVDGYIKALSDHKIDYSSDLIIKINKASDFELQLQYTLENYAIDALLCLEEKSALKSMLYVKSKGYDIPNDISMICFTNSLAPRYVTPSISTISQHGREMGRIAAKKLIERIENGSNDDYNTQVITTSFIERNSTLTLP